MSEHPPITSNVGAVQARDLPVPEGTRRADRVDEQQRRRAGRARYFVSDARAVALRVALHGQRDRQPGGEPRFVEVQGTAEELRAIENALERVDRDAAEVERLEDAEDARITERQQGH